MDTPKNPYDSPDSQKAGQQDLSLLISYARRDQRLRDQLENHLSNLKYRGLITNWTAKDIAADEEMVDLHTTDAHIILLLISASFLASPYCYGQEMQQVIQHHKQGKINIIPILLRPVLFKDAPFAPLTPTTHESETRGEVARPGQCLCGYCAGD